MSKFLLGLLLLYGCRSQQTPNAIVNENNKISAQIDSIKSIIKEGDIVFRGGTDIESNIIREFSFNNKMFSHCGIILKNGNSLQVTHILGGVTNPTGAILSETINNFINYPQNESIGIYNANLSGSELLKINTFINAAKNKGVTFDLDFNLFTKDKLYCTELLVDAIRFTKCDTTLFKPTAYNLKNTKYFFLSNSKDEFLFYPIDEFEKTMTPKQIFLFPNYQLR